MAVTPLTPAQQAAVDALADAYRRSAVDLETLAPMLDTSARRHRTSDGGELLEKRGSGPAEEVRKVLVKQGRTER